MRRSESIKSGPAKAFGPVWPHEMSTVFTVSTVLVQHVLLTELPEH